MKTLIARLIEGLKILQLISKSESFHVSYDQFQVSDVDYDALTPESIVTLEELGFVWSRRDQIFTFYQD